MLAIILSNPGMYRCINHTQCVQSRMTTSTRSSVYNRSNYNSLNNSSASFDLNNAYISRANLFDINVNLPLGHQMALE